MSLFNNVDTLEFVKTHAFSLHRRGELTLVCPLQLHSATMYTSLTRYEQGKKQMLCHCGVH